MCVITESTRTEVRAVEEEEEEEEEEDMWLGYNLNKSYITHIEV